MKLIQAILVMGLVTMLGSSVTVAAKTSQSERQTSRIDLSALGRGTLTTQQYPGGTAYTLNQRWVRHSKISPAKYEDIVRRGSAAPYTVEIGSEEVMQKPFPNGKLYGRNIVTQDGQRVFSMVVICDSRKRSRFFELWGERDFILGSDSTPIVDFVVAAGKGCGNKLDKRSSKLPPAKAATTGRLAKFIAPTPWQEQAESKARFSEAPARHFKLGDLYDMTIEKATGPAGRVLTKWAFNWIEVHMNNGDITERSLMFWEQENAQLYGTTIVTLADGEKARMFWLWSKNSAERLVMTVISNREPDTQERQTVIDLVGTFE